MTSVLGIDPGCAHLGLALPSGRCITLSSPTKAVGPRLRWIAERFGRQLDTYRPTVAVLCGYAPHSVGTLSTIRVAEAGGVIRLGLEVLGAHVVEIPDSRIKRFAVNVGNASKGRLVEAALNAGFDVDDDHQADAAWARSIAVYALDGHPPGDEPDQALADARLDVLAHIAWPVLA